MDDTDSRFSMMDTQATDGGGMRLQVDYLADNQEFEVLVSVRGRVLSERFPCTHVVFRGVDAEDHAKAMQIAEALAGRLEEGEGDPLPPEDDQAEPQS